MKAAREAWFKGQPALDPARLVFLDETWTSTNMALTRGRSPRGERLRSPVPHGHWKTTTFFAGLRLSGIAALRIPTKPAGDSDLKPAVIPRRSRPPVRSEAGQRRGAPAGLG